jgi:cell shape-determining protein MreD
MKILLLAAITYAIFALQSAIARDLTLAGFTPHLVLASLVLLTARMTRAGGIWLSAIWGLLADSCLGDGRLGPHIACFILFVLFLQRAKAWQWCVTPWKLAAVSLPLVAATLFAEHLLRGMADRRGINVMAAAIQSAGIALYTMFIVAAMASLWQRFAPLPVDRGESRPASVSNSWRMLTE